MVEVSWSCTGWDGGILSCLGSYNLYSIECLLKLVQLVQTAVSALCS